MAGFTIVGGRVHDANNVLIPIRGISHYGWAPLGWPQYLWQQNWQAQLNQIKSMGFNNVRAPVSPLVIHSARICPDTYRSGTGTVSSSINPDLIGKTPLQILDMWMAYCDKIGLYVMLDMHSILYEPPVGMRLGVWEVPTGTPNSPYLWKPAPYTAADWINDLVFLASRYASNAHFMAIEPFNEPHDEGVGHPRWDSGDPLMTDSLQYWRPNIENAAAAILAANPNLLICVQGCIASDGVSPSVPINWGEDLRPQAYKPLNTAKLPANKTIFSPHSYGPDVFVKSSFTDVSFPANLAANWEATFGFLYPTFCVAPSEWGGHYGTGTGSGGGAYPPGITAATDKTWQDAFRDWMNAKGMRDSWYWAYPQANDDAGGILDGSLNVRQDKLTLLQSHWAITPVALTVPRNTTFDTRIFAPYVRTAIPNQSVAIGTVVSLNLAFYIPGGVSPTYGISPAIPGLSLNTSTGMLTGTVTTAQAPTTITVTVTNSVNSVQTAFSWTTTLSGFAVPNLTATAGQSIPLSSYYTIPPGEVYVSSEIVDSAGNPSPGKVAELAAIGVTLNSSQQRFDTTTPGGPVGGVWLKINSGVSIVAPIVLTSTVGGTLLPFTFGQPFKKGDVPAGAYITTDAPQSQAEVRNRWSDGSVKFAVITGRKTMTTAANTVQIQRTSVVPGGADITEPVTADITAAGATQVVMTGVGAGTYRLQDVLGIDRSTWSRGNGGRLRAILGPVMSEFHYYQPTSDTQLAIYWYVRRYSDRMEIETAIEQGWTKAGVSSPANKSYVVTVTINGTNKVTALSVNHRHHARWSRRDWIGTDPQITPAHNAAYLKSTKLVPNYMAITPANTNAQGPSGIGVSGDNIGMNNYAQTIQPMQIGNMEQDTRGGGVHAVLGILPEWEAAYVISGDVRAYKAILTNEQAGNCLDLCNTAGQGSATYGAGFVQRDETTGLPACPLDYAGFDYGDLGNLPGGSTGAAGAVCATDVAHSWSIGYLAYLVTGRWFALESAQFNAATVFLVTSGNSGGGTSNRLTRTGQDRGCAWAVRSMSQAVAVTPDSHPKRASYLTWYGNNITAWRTGEVGGTSGSALSTTFNSLGLRRNIFDGGPGNPSAGGLGNFFSFRVFMNLYLTQSFIHAHMVAGDALAVSPLADSLAAAQFHGQLPAGLAGARATGFSYRQAATTGGSSNDLACGPTQSNFNSWYADFAAMYAGSVSAGAISNLASDAPGQSLLWDYIPTSVGITGNFISALAHATDMGTAGASAGWTRITGASNWTHSPSPVAGDVMHPAEIGRGPAWAIEPR